MSPFEMGMTPVIAAEEHGTTVTVTIRRPTLGYLDQFVTSRCGPDLLTLGLYPNAKEITESMAAWRACARLGTPALDDPAVTALVVGDGRTPRTGALLAFRSAWRVVSVDPLLAGHEDDWPSIRRLVCVGRPIEALPRFTFPGPVVLVAVHSHARLEHAWAQVARAERLDVVAIPCCVPQSIGALGPTAEYDDWRIWSPQRRVRVWRDVSPAAAGAQPSRPAAAADAAGATPGAHP